MPASSRNLDHTHIRLAEISDQHLQTIPVVLECVLEQLSQVGFSPSVITISVNKYSLCFLLLLFSVWEQL